MKETTSISISGIAFLIEKDACDLLEGYISKLESIYDNTPDGKEIIEDIEARIAELLLSWQPTLSSPVTIDSAQKVIDQLGFPDSSEESGDDYSQKAKEYNAANDHPSSRLNKRLYRNMEGAKLGGVLNGIATYWDIDVSWLRSGYVFALIVFFLFNNYTFNNYTIMSNGQHLNFTLIALYIGLWIIIPRAKTPRQKLEMRGERITVSKLENSIREEMNTISSNPKNGKSASIFAEIIYAMGRIVRFVLIVFASLLAVSMAVFIITVIVSVVYFYPELKNITELFLDINPLSGIILTTAAAIVPVLAFVILLVQMIFRLRIHKAVHIGVILLWLGLWATLFVSVILEKGGSFKYRETTNEISDIKLGGDTLYVLPAKEVLRWDFIDFCYYGYILENVKFEIDEAQAPMVTIEKTASNRNQDMAINSAKQIKAGYKQVGDTIFVDSQFEIDKNMKYLNQKVVISIAVPANVLVVMDERFYRSSYAYSDREIERIGSYIYYKRTRTNDDVLDDEDELLKIKENQNDVVDLVIGNEDGTHVKLYADSTSVKITKIDESGKQTNIIDINKNSK